MKMVRENKSKPAGVTSANVVIGSFLKMLTAAIVCGLAVSFAAAGVALLLTSTAEARSTLIETTNETTNKTTSPSPRSSDDREDDTEDEPGSELSATPGMLLIGDGCDGIALRATERDWQVSIDGKRIRVRVMQSFQMPSLPIDIAAFHVQLPKGARLQSLAALTASKDLPGQLLSADEYDRLASADYLRLVGNRLLVSQTALGTVMTSPLPDLAPESLLTIQYTYIVESTFRNGLSEFLLPLEPLEPEAEQSERAYPGTITEPFPALSANAAGGAVSVWVEWVGRKPIRVIGLPADAALETVNARIERFSWATHGIQPGAHFHLAWTR